MSTPHIAASIPPLNRTSHNRRLYLWHCILIALVCLPVLLLRLETYPALWFDEGYKLNAVRTLVERGFYGTHTAGGDVPFDPGTSAGPLDTGANAFSASLFGVGISQARLVSVGFTLIAVYSLYAIAVYLWGTQAGLVSLLFLLAFPTLSDTGFLLIGRQILSEPVQLGSMALGLALYFHAIERRSIPENLLAGFIIGLGLLSKLQVAIGLVPALFLIAVIRAWWERGGWRGWALHLAPVTMALAVIVGWNLIGTLATPPDIRQQNSALLMDAIRSNLITDLFGRALTQASALVDTFMLLGVGGAVYRLYRAHRPSTALGNRQWAELTLVLFVLLTALWHAGLSVGWPRYAYAGLVIGVLLIGRTVWGAYQRFAFWERGYRWALAGLVILGMGSNLLPLFRTPLSTDAQDTAAYITANIPPDALIETWEWEVDALSGHWQTHHPPQQNLFKAIRQFALDQPFALEYDALQYDPDYLIAGRMSDWTGIYTPVLGGGTFREVAAFGIYRVYERQR